MKLPAVDKIHPQSNTFAIGVEGEATGDLELNDSQGTYRDLNDDRDVRAGLLQSGKI